MNLINFDLPRYALILNVGIAGLAAVGAAILTGGEVLLAVPALTVLFTLFLLARSSREAARAEAALTVPLTGLATEEAAQEALSREFAAALRGRALTVVLIRLEGLSRYRSRHGDAVTEQLMQLAGRTLLRHRREMNLTAHHGGREGTFLSILSGTDAEGAAVYAARVRRDLLRLSGIPAHGGVSIGIASFDAEMETPRALVRKAAFALERGAAAPTEEDRVEVA